MIITKLSNVGVQKASVQSSHAAILTLDGRAYLWGRNDYNQVTTESNIDQSSPKLFEINGLERIKDLACGTFQTLLLSSQLSLKYIGRRSSAQTDKITNLCSSAAMININDKTKNNILVSSEFFILNGLNVNYNYVADFVVNEQQFLEEMLNVHSNLIKAMLKKNVYVDMSVFEDLTRSYTELLYFTAANVQSLLDFTNGLIFDVDIIIVKHSDEHLYIYKRYLNAINDIISLGAFTHISKVVDTNSLFYKLKGDNILSKNKGEDVIQAALTLPLQRLSTYPNLIRILLTFSKKEQKLQELLNRCSSLIEEQHQKQIEAEKTKDFWLNSGKNVEQFRTANRRLIRESHRHPIQLQNAGRFSSHWIILLTDILIHVNGSTPHVHDLTTIWVEPPTDDSYNQNQICLKMPEETLLLCTIESEQKAEWLQSLQNAIKAVLNKPNGIQPPSVRSAEYTFTKTGFYKDAKYKGRWTSGKMHGSGRLEWTDGKVYIGQFSNNQIHGFGRMEMPAIGSIIVL